MTMHIVYLKDFEGHKAGDPGYEERTRARRLCNNGVVEPYMTHAARQKPVEKAVLIEPEPDVEAEAEAEPGLEPEPEAEPKPRKPRGRKRRTEKAVKL